MSTVPQQRYEVSSHDGREMQTQSVGAEERGKLNLDQYEMVISTADGVFAFQPTRGERIEFLAKWPGIGPVGLDILRTLQLNAGDFLTPVEIANLTGFDSLRENGNLAARIAALRRTLQDKTQHFIETRPSGGYAVRWVKDRTWIWIDRIPACSASQSQPIK